MLRSGCRASGHAPCRWGALLPSSGAVGNDRITASHVWLEESGQYGPYVFFYRTKGGRSHRLPLGPMALELLRRRQLSAAAEVARRGFGVKARPFVFPARSKFSASGHYTDAKDLLRRIRDDAGIDRLTRHDLRRSFGTMMVTLDVHQGIRRRFFNHADADVTETYTKAEWDLLKSEMARIEQALLAKAPNVYNALKPVEWPPLPATEPIVCSPAKSRSGRPRRSAAESVGDT